MEKEVPEVERKRLVKRKYVDKIDSTLSRTVIDQKELYFLVRGFFSELLKLDYEFTYEELSSELNKIFLKSALKEEIEDFLYDLSESEYFLEKDLEQEQIRGFVVHLQNIVKSMIYDIEIPTHKSSFLEKIFKRNKNTSSPSETSLPSFEDALKDNLNPDKIVSTNVAPSDVVSNNANFLSQDAASPNSIRSNDTSSKAKAINDVKDVSSKGEENELFTQKLFEDYGTAEINSDTQESNILLTFGDSSAGDDSDIINSSTRGSNSDIRETDNEPQKKSGMNRIKDVARSTKSKDEIVASSNKSSVQDLHIKERTSENNILMVEDNSPDMVAMHELMEESYLQMNNSKIDTAKRSYLKALDIYHKLTVSDKRLVYDELYILFKKLKPL